jgi:aspartyl-tRNA(Asn)/glutamyl-tRNA(Gln) amidotransferase subunit A
MSIPCGHDSNNLPIGMQLIAPPFAEETILRAGDAFERTGAFKPRTAAGTL